jgi:hypothetical protein
LRIGKLNRRHMMLGFKDGTVQVIDVENPKTILLETKFKGGAIKDIFFTTAIAGVVTATTEDNSVWIQKVDLDPNEKLGTVGEPV